MMVTVGFMEGGAWDGWVYCGAGMLGVAVV